MNTYRSLSTTSSKATESGSLYDIEVVKEDVLSLLLMRKGDLPMNMDIGCIIHNYVFHQELNSDEKAEIIEDTTAQLARGGRLYNINVSIETTGTSIIVAIYADVHGIDDTLQLNLALQELASYG